MWCGVGLLWCGVVCLHRYDLQPLPSARAGFTQRAFGAVDAKVGWPRCERRGLLACGMRHVPVREHAWHGMRALGHMRRMHVCVRVLPVHPSSSEPLPPPQVVDWKGFAWRATQVVCGPTDDDLPPFKWQGAGYDGLFDNVTREGVVDSFTFGWQVYVPRMLPARGA